MVLSDHLPVEGETETRSWIGWFGWPIWVWLVIAVVAVVLLLLASVIIVPQKKAYIMERLGQFHTVKHAGLRWRIPFIDFIRDRAELWLKSLEIEVETKTKDNVFVLLKLAIQARVDASSDQRIADSYYELGDADEQIAAFVSNHIRAVVPTLDLDDVFADITEVAARIERELANRMSGYGHLIEAVLVTDIKPADEVVASMNAINAAKRQVEVAEEEGRAEVIRATKHGEGLAGQRRAIAAGLADSLRAIEEAGGDGGVQVAQTVLLASMHYEALTTAAHGQATTILLPSGADEGARLISNLLAANNTNGS